MSQPPRERKRIGEMLVAEGYIAEGQIEEALDIQRETGGRILEILMDLGYLDMRSFAEFLATKRNVPSIQLSHYQVDQALCELIPREFAVTHEVFPVDRMGKLLTVGMVCPLDTATLDILSSMTGLKVKAMLCEPEDLRNAIARYYPEDDGAEPTDDQVISSARLTSVARLVRQIDSLPTLPESVNRIKEAMSDPGITMPQLAQSIALDPSVTARVLHLANSSAYGFPNSVDDIAMAVTLLGLRETYMVVVSSAVLNLAEQSKQFDYEGFRQRAVFTAAAARHISAAVGEGKNSAAFTASLLHEIGRYGLSEAAAARYNKLDSGLFGRELAAAERDALGIAHPEAGFLLAERWDFPQDIVEAIRLQYRPTEARGNKTVVAITALAVALKNARNAEPDSAEALFALCSEEAGALGLDAEEVYGVYNKALHDTAQDTTN